MSINDRRRYLKLKAFIEGDNMKQENLIEKLKQMEEALDKGFKGKITDVEETTNNEFFKDKGTYEQRDGLKVSVKIDSPDGADFSQFFAFPKTTGLRQSNIGLFKKRYGSFPKKGLMVDVVLNEDGFFRVVV